MKKLIVMLLVTFSVVTAGAWVIETVDSWADVGITNSLALDSLDNPHISYIYHGDSGSYQLKYIRWNGSAWQKQTVQQGLAEYISLALDSNDSPHISFLDTYNNWMRYAHLDTTWQFELLEVGDGMGTSLVLDSSDTPHIVYINGYPHYNLVYMRLSSPWHWESLDFYGATPSLALDSYDNPHIACSGHSGPKYARWDGSAWQVENVDSDGPSGADTSLALDSSGNPRISYFDSTNRYIKYAWWDGSDWQIETVGEPENVGWFTSLALDSSGNPHISYYDAPNGDLKYAYWDGSDWQVEAIDFVGTYTFWWRHSSLALDSSDNPHISYYDNTNEDLKYAYWDPDASGVDDLSLAAEVADDGVLLSWSIVGDTPASVSVLRGLSQNDTLTQNGSVDLSGELAGSATSWLDVSVEAGVEYAYYLEVTELDGTVSRFGPSEVVVPGAVSELALSDPYPNPADDSLTIHYELTQNATVKLHIYDLSGRLVETLVSGEQTAGRHSVNWDSSVAATGVYLLRLEANGEAITKRAVISR